MRDRVQLARTLLDIGWSNELGLMILPVVIGDSKRLFDSDIYASSSLT